MRLTYSAHGTCLAAAGAAFLTWGGPCFAGVADPMIGVRTLYSAYQAGATNASSVPAIDTLYLWADRNLKRKLLANNVCTFPVGKRDVRCGAPFDPPAGGATAQLGNPAFTLVAGGSASRTVTVAFTDGDGVEREVTYRFTRQGREWELTEAEGRASVGKGWKLSEIVG